MRAQAGEPTRPFPVEAGDPAECDSKQHAGGNDALRYSTVEHMPIYHCNALRVAA